MTDDADRTAVVDRLAAALAACVDELYAEAEIPDDAGGWEHGHSAACKNAARRILDILADTVIRTPR